MVFVQFKNISGKWRLTYLGNLRSINIKLDRKSFFKWKIIKGYESIVYFMINAVESRLRALKTKIRTDVRNHMILRSQFPSLLATQSESQKVKFWLIYFLVKSTLFSKFYKNLWCSLPIFSKNYAMTLETIIAIRSKRKLLLLGIVTKPFC